MDSTHSTARTTGRYGGVTREERKIKTVSNLKCDFEIFLHCVRFFSSVRRFYKKDQFQRKILCWNNPELHILSFRQCHYRWPFFLPFTRRKRVKNAKFEYLFNAIACLLTFILIFKDEKKHFSIFESQFS